MNDAWRQADSDSHYAKAEAISHAIDALEGVNGALDKLERNEVEATVAILKLARDRHDVAGKLTAA